MKQKLKTAKHHQHSDDDDLVALRQKDVLEANKKKKKKNEGSKLQHSEVSSTTTKSVDWISNYQPRKYLLVKPGGKWYNERVSYSLVHY